MSKKSVYILILLIILLSLGIRFYFAFHCNVKWDFSDMATYQKAALGKDLIPTSVPPGYPLFLRIIYKLFGADNRIVYVIQAIISTLSVLLIFWLAKRIFNENVGLIAAFVAAIYPNFIIYNLTILTESIGVFLILLLLTTIYLPINESKRSILSGIVLVLAYAVKPVFLFFAPAQLFSLKKRIIFLLTLTVFFVPVIIFNGLTGHGTNRPARAFFRTYNEKSTGRLSSKLSDTKLGRSDLPSSVYIKEALRFIKHNKWKTIDIIYYKSTILVSRGWDSFVFTSIVGKRSNVINLLIYSYIPIMLLGFLGMFRYFNKTSKALTLMVFSYLVIIIGFFIFKVRYRLLIEPILIIFSSVLIERCIRKISFPRIKKNWYKELLNSLIGRKSVTQSGYSGQLFKNFQKDKGILILILICVLALHIYFVYSLEAYGNTNNDNQYDKHLYSVVVSPTAPPVYPLFLRAVYSIFGRYNHSAVFIAQAIIHMIIILLVYGIVSSFFNNDTGLIAAIISACYPRLLVYSMAVDIYPFVFLLVVLFMFVSLVKIREVYRTIIYSLLTAFGIFLSPVLFWFTPGVFLISTKKKLFIVFLIIWLLPFTLANISRYNELVPVYKGKMYSVSLHNYTKALNGWKTIDNLYNNISHIRYKEIFNMKNIYASQKASVNNAYFVSYSYILLMILGLIGLARYYNKRHKTIVWPVMGFVLIIIFFSSFRNEYKVLLEPLYIVYASVLLNNMLSGAKIKSVLFSPVEG